MTYEEHMKKYKEHKLQIQREVENLVAFNDSPNGKDILDKRFLRDFGCINFKSDEWMHELELAREYHRLLCESPVYKHEHHAYEREPYRCYHVTGCSCGFAEACDSSD